MIYTNLIVNTWAKYNRGILCIKTIDPANYETEAAFYADCKEMHADEVSPEFLFQSANGLPSAIVDDFGFNWALMGELLRHEENGKGQAFISFLKLKGNCSAEYFNESYIGMAKTQVDALEIITDMDALLEPLPEGLRGYFDFEAYARDIFLNEYDLFNGFVYRKV
ncbi:antirestriction protein ArdA [Erwinia amylovora]|uniref:antirestriction protein ArdA n=1 Tax=Erwinia amylovora TaxID=552 RepID=UPI0020C0F6A9|nr:antirestriction protein ArdA [Erwinia amylovora]MCK8417584.1 antirestriction protein ArdA [Erwinia amylovora]